MAPRRRKETVEDQLKRASYAREKAALATTAEDKKDWLQIAREWEALAEQKGQTKRKKPKRG